MNHEPIRILYVEDDAYDVVILEETLRSSKAFKAAYSITHAKDLFAGLEMVKKRSFDVILLDLNLPEGTGHNNVTVFKKHAVDTPIICLTSMNCDHLAMEALQAGAQEYIVKGFGNAHILNRVIRSAIFRQHIENDLRNQARFDNLTGLPNNVFINQTISSFIARANEWGYEDSLLLMSVSNFRHICTEHGHEVGRQVAVKTAETMRRVLKDEFAGALNEGELVIYLHNAALNDVCEITAKLAERLIDACSTDMKINGKDIPVFVNIGASIYPNCGSSYSDLLDYAYDALFIAGSYGHSKYCMADDDFIRGDRFTVSMQKD